MRRKCRELSLLSACAFLALSSAAFGQRGMGQPEGVARQGIRPDIITLEGTVQEVVIGPCGETTGRSAQGAHVILSTDGGQEYNVHLGPSQFVTKATDALGDGAPASFRVFRTERLPANHYVAVVVKVGGQAIRLRERNLRPVWAAGQGRGAGRAGPGPGFGRQGRRGPGQGRGWADMAPPADEAKDSPPVGPGRGMGRGRQGMGRGGPGMGRGRGMGRYGQGEGPAWDDEDWPGCCRACPGQCGRAMGGRGQRWGMGPGGPGMGRGRQGMGRGGQGMGPGGQGMGPGRLGMGRGGQGMGGGRQGMGFGGPGMGGGRQGMGRGGPGMGRWRQGMGPGGPGMGRGRGMGMGPQGFGPSWGPGPAADEQMEGPWWGASKQAQSPELKKEGRDAPAKRQSPQAAKARAAKLDKQIRELEKQLEKQRAKLLELQQEQSW